MSIAELDKYLGDDFKPSLLAGNDALVVGQARAFGSALEFYKKNTIYLYHLTMFAGDIWKQPYYIFVREVRTPCKVLDYGCGIGADGLTLAEWGYKPSFADYQSECTKYLRWRLKRRKLKAAVYDIEKDDIPRHPLVVAFDVIEHIPPDEQWLFLERLAELGETVVLNLNRHRPSVYDSIDWLHYKVDIEALEKKIGNRHTVLSAKTYNDFARLIAFKTKVKRVRRRTKRVKIERTEGELNNG